MCKKGFPAHDEKNEVEKKQSFGWLPEKKASLASYLQKQKEQSQLLSQAHELFLKGLKHYNVGCVNFLKWKPFEKCVVAKIMRVWVRVTVKMLIRVGVWIKM